MSAHQVYQKREKYNLKNLAMAVRKVLLIFYCTLNGQKPAKTFMILEKKKKNTKNKR